jgi:excinuclease ABC subunit B
MPQRDIIKRLVAMQYERNDIDFQRGTFRVRGDVIDVFPAENAEHAVRIELFDDEIEHLTLFDPLTGHMLHKLARFTVYPSSHYVTPRAPRCAPSRRSRRSCASGSSSSAGEKLVEAQRIEQRTRFDLEMLNEMGFCKGIENYSRHCPGASRASRRRR